MRAYTLIVAIAISAGLLGCSPTDENVPGIERLSSAEVVLVEDAVWEQLNPLRRDKSPKAGTLWGDRTGPGPAGFLLRPADGFRSPPHIHNVAYRGVVIRGLLHNDDPDAENMWMPTASFWTQPAGGIHITAAKGEDCLAYIEVEDGFGVLPAADAFQSPEKPVNVDVTNLVWLDPPGRPGTAGGPQVAFLWGNPKDDRPAGALVRFSAGTTGEIRGLGASLRAVTIDGRINLHQAGSEERQALNPGSYFHSTGKALHRVSAGAEQAGIVYLRVEGAFEIGSVK